jgi:hypothetical protein
MGRFDSLLQMESNASDSPPSVGAVVQEVKDAPASVAKSQPTSSPVPRKQLPPVQPAPLKQTNKLANGLTSYHASMIASIRKVVRQQGQHVSFTRLTPEEKQQLAEIVFAYKRQGIRTSENEINRIAINYLLADYQARGKDSLLALVLAALYA